MIHTNMFNENRWAFEEEFKKGLTSHKLLENCTMSGMPLLVEEDISYTDTSNKHSLIYGATDSKKTRNFVVPTVYSLAMAGESMIITDPKGEIYRFSSGYLSHEGYTIHVVNFRDPLSSSRWNPLSKPYRFYKMGEEDRAREMVADFCVQLKSTIHSEKDIYWESIASDTLFGITMLLFQLAPNESVVNMESLLQLRRFLLSHDEDEHGHGDIFWNYISTLPENSIIRYKLASLESLRSVAKTFGCVISTLDTMIAPFIMQKSLSSLMGHSDFDYSDLAEKKTAIFLIIPDEKRTLHFLASVFVKQCYESLIHTAQTCKDGMLPQRVNFVLDEFANSPKIADMSSMISAARSRKIRFYLIVQSKQQLYSIYDKDADTIRSNCGTWIFLASREMELLEEMEGLCGLTFVEGRGYIPMMSTSSLQYLEIGWTDSQALILRPQTRPYLSWIKDFSVYPQARYEEISLPKRSTEEEVPYFSFMQYLNGEYDTIIDSIDINDILI